MPMTALEGVLGEHELLQETRLGSGLAVWLGEIGETGALLHVCRPVAGREEGCSDGRDDDCDGLTDGEDPDCLPAHKQ